MKTLHTTIGALSLLVALPTTAATVSFSTASYTTGGISTNGTFIGALTAFSTTTVNTVEFTGINAAGANVGDVALSGGVSVDIFNQNVNNVSNVGVDDSGSDALRDDALAGGGSVGDATGTLGFRGLTINQQYEFQLILSDLRFTNNDVDIWFNQADNSGTADIDDLSIKGDGVIITGTFTADSADQDMYIVQTVTTHGSFPGFMSSMQLRAVPEPSSTALLGLGGLALILRRRK